MAATAKRASVPDLRALKTSFPEISELELKMIGVLTDAALMVLVYSVAVLI